MYLLADTNPSPLWFATRGAGITTMVLLTVVVVLGIATAQRWEGADTPRFFSAVVHRNLALFSIVLLVVHVAASVFDPFAHISLFDSIVPFAASYRPIWLGLGVFSMELLVAVIVTSLLRFRVGLRTWRLVHWLAYLAWPLSILHSLGTGTDVTASWFIGIVVACVAAVLVALLRRLSTGPLITLPLRVGAVAAIAILLAVATNWTVQGPLRPGWPALAGTPKDLLSKPTTSPTPVHLGPGGFQDGLVGTLSKDSNGNATISFKDTVDTSLTVVILPPYGTQSLPTIQIARDGKTICQATASVSDTLYTVCGSTRLQITVFGEGPSVTGTLTTSGPLQ